jgi:hypothetical protein
MILVIGVLSVTGLHARTISITPEFSPGNQNQSYNITVTNDNGNDLNLLRVTKPGDFSDIKCYVAPPSGWTCTNTTATYVEFTGGTIAAGASQSFNITALTADNGINFTFTFRTEDDGASFNTTGNLNVTVDNQEPFVELMNVSDGTNVLTRTDTNGQFFLSNSTAGFTFVFNATDNQAVTNASGISQVLMYYNVSTLDETVIGILTPSLNGSNVTRANTSNLSYGVSSLFNATVNLSGYPLLNGSVFRFIVIANDTMGNGNQSNTSTGLNSNYSYNFTIDSVEPLFEEIIVTNASGTNNDVTNSTNTSAPANAKPGVQMIVNSTVLLNITTSVHDGGGSGVVSTEVRDRTGTYIPMDVLAGSNGSNTKTLWNNSRFNISDLVTGFSGDGVYNITFQTTDNVSNVNASFNYTIEVDDSAPTGVVFTNLTADNGILSAANATLDMTVNKSFNITLVLSDNIDNTTKNVTVKGNKGAIFNMTYVDTGSAGDSVWFIEIANNSNLSSGVTGQGVDGSINATNLSAFCDLTAVNGQECNLQFDFSDVMGQNGTVNLTLRVDTIAPNITSLSPLNISTTNYSGTLTLNLTINDSIGPISNVSFRLRNSSVSDAEIGYSNSTANFDTGNVTNWIPMTFSTGSNEINIVNGTWTYVVNLTAAGLGDGNFSVEYNVSDSSANLSNDTENSINLIFDSTAPSNFTFRSIFTDNSFHNSNYTFNVSINVTEQYSGLLNVSFRLENNTHNWSWTDTTTAITALAHQPFLNASFVNITNWGIGHDNYTNATDGNFTVRLNVTDTAGNQNTTHTFNITIDTVAPTVTINSPTAFLNESGNFTVNVTVTESNIDTVFYQWVNDSSGSTVMEHTSRSVEMTEGLDADTYNATFTNMTDESFNFVSGNYSIRINVSDKAGNNLTTSVFVQLILDPYAPHVAPVAPAASSLQTGDFTINATINDTAQWGQNLGLFNSTNINDTAINFRLENSSFNSSWISLNASTNDLLNLDANRTNRTATFSDFAEGRYDIRFMVNDSSGNSNDTETILNVTLDNTAPGVSISADNVTPTPSGGSGISGSVTFNITVTDTMPINISIANFSDVLGYNGTLSDSTYGVFYRYENATLNFSNGTWLPMNLVAFSETEADSAVYNATNDTTLYADGDYTIRFNVTDRAGNQNTTTTLGITIQNGATNPKVKNITFLGGYITGSDTNQTSPTLLVNTTVNATCKYSLDTPQSDYEDLTSTMGNNVSRQHSTALGFQPDRAANGYSIYYSCRDINGINSPNLDNATSLFTFSVDTRAFYNITIGTAGNNKVRGDYFAVGWNSFALPKTTLLANTGLNDTYNVTEVLNSLGSGDNGAASNYTIIYAYNGSSWASFDPDRSANSFTNFTSDLPSNIYFINISVANERLEIN